MSNFWLHPIDRLFRYKVKITGFPLFSSKFCHTRIMLRMALRKAETLVVKQFLIAFVIHAGVWSSRDK
ncbi:hypothetical protein, partial [Nostoc sp.]|uniref:hypothetical protein n=1 Tax=Nostoc sp. TaxID=1180 RepID=UPI003FA571D9